MMMTWLMRIVPLLLHVDPSRELTGCIQTFDDKDDQTDDRNDDDYDDNDDDNDDDDDVPLTCMSSSF